MEIDLGAEITALSLTCLDGKAEKSSESSVEHYGVDIIDKPMHEKKTDANT